MIEQFEQIVKSLMAQIDKLEDKINKANNFIKENACYDKDTKKCCDDLNYNDCDKLLEILGGIENETIN